MKTLEDVGDVKGKRALVRVDWNVPLENGKVRDDSRIKHSLETIQDLMNMKARVVLMSHLESEETDSLLPIYEHAKKLIPLKFCDETVGEKAEKQVRELEQGQVLLVENLRRNKGEKENKPEFAEQLARLGDLYVNEAFSASHREHASIVGVPEILPGFIGIEFKKEIDSLKELLHPEHPFLFILGGAKFETKLPLLNKFVQIADTIFVGGALAHNFFREKHLNIGKSLISEGEFGIDRLLASGKIMLPIDVVVKRGSKTETVKIEEVEDGDIILDSGPKTTKKLKEKIGESQLVLWNGPLGNYEEGFKDGTLGLARVLARSGKHSVLGGADTIAAIKELKIFDKFTFVSTGGGAMLDYLAHETLPGLEVLK
ncbi:phosphoglycerate kinase [Candidatus Parcubacteria bacterium]|nr:phosphoglycerate kinase [Candidatus Parcubacteria bacterium]